MKPVTITIENYTEKIILLEALVAYSTTVLKERGKKYEYPNEMLPDYFKFEVAAKYMREISKDLLHRISHAKAPE